MNDVGKRIKYLRERHGISQRELATEINKSIETIKKYEDGRLGVSIDVLLDISEVLNVMPSKLLGLDDMNIVDIIKKSYGIKTDNEMFEYDLNVCMAFLKAKYDN